MSDEELKPCPFCGNEDLSVEPVRMTKPIWYVYCGGCFVDGPEAESEASAKAAWNTRVHFVDEEAPDD